jgi:hypothetical protein
VGPGTIGEMAVVVALVVLGAAFGWLWWAGALEGITDRVKDGLAVLYPARPLSRRALPRRLLRAATRTVTVGVSGTALLPTQIEIVVNPGDLEPFADALDWLGEDIATALRKKAAAEGWMVPRGPKVVIVPDEERPLRVPRATGRIGALSPDELRTLERSGELPALAERGGPRDNPIPTGYTGSAPTQLGDPTVAPAGQTRSPRTSHIGDPAGSARPDGRGTGRTVPVPVAPTGRTAQTAPTAAALTLHLRLVSGHGADDDLSAILTSAQAPLVLGRSRQSDLRVRDRHASGRHCTFSIAPDDGTVVVEDLQSTNGTFVEGRRVRRATLHPGEVLRIGDSSWRIAMDGITST